MSGRLACWAIVAAGMFGAVCAGDLAADEPATHQIKWHNDPKAATKIARDNNRPVLVYVTSANCGYCRKMERQSWANATIVKAVDADYVPLRLHAEQHPQLVQQLRVQAFPTTILFTPQLKFHEGAAGYLSPQELTQLLSHRPSSAVPASVSQ